MNRLLGLVADLSLVSLVALTVSCDRPAPTEVDLATSQAKFAAPLVGDSSFIMCTLSKDDL